MEWCATRTMQLERQFENFMGTGNLPAECSGLGLMQNKGLTIMAENINRMRYMSHFRAIHRGSFFQEMRTTEVRALLPDAWGFVCPVHTPDGAPCGLLNHLAFPVEIVTHAQDASAVPDVLVGLGKGLSSLFYSLFSSIQFFFNWHRKLRNLIVYRAGMSPLGEASDHTFKSSYTVVLDGRVLGYVPKKQVSLSNFGDAPLPLLTDE